MPSPGATGTDIASATVEEASMKLERIAVATVLSVVACGAGLSAQSAERKEKTKIEVKGGKEVTLTGCLERSSGVTDYELTDSVGRLKYSVVTDDDLDKYVGRRVEIKGRAADRGDGKVKVEHTVEGTSGDTSQAKVEARGDTAALPFLGLKSIKTIAPTCR
jgi:hypothetical protein